ncbi:MAG: hypothetical protein ACP5IX_02045 [Patescibacteria group bacterium]
MVSLIKAARPNQQLVFGATFSRFRAEYLDLDWRKVYLEILDELKIKKFRLSAYWPDIEIQPGIFDFSNLDWQINEAEKRGGEIILVLGWRLPGWPECHSPEWAKNLSKTEREKKILNLIEKVVERYKNRLSIWAWQVENEPFLSAFGLCPPTDRQFFEKELALVKSLDKRPIIVSASGELSTWITEARYADILGITIYRATYNKYFKYFYYPYPALFYYLKSQLVKFLFGPKKIIVVELQAEPWTPGDLKQTTLEEQFKTMNLRRFKKVFNYIKGTGFDEFYLWGAEWWYWLKKQGYPEIWEEAKRLWINQ